MTRLKIANDLTLPLDLVTQTVAILAKRRAGKSYTMRRIAEQLFKAGQQIVIVDPKGDQWGIRSAADGKAPGLPVIIIGGERGDVPLEVGAGEVVAKLVVEERVSVLLDLSLFRKTEVARFMTDFLENLYRLKAREIYRTPVMLVVDEADAIAPQKPQPGEERMLGAIEDIVRRGGQRGIGCVLVTQRSAVLNKNVLTQAQILVALRTIAPQDLKAMKEWIDVHGEDAERKLLMESLPSLPVGQAWFWSPGWPTNEGIFQRVTVLPIETFDSGATPKPGERRIEPKSAADVDLDALKRQMAATIEKAKADDPRELRKQIADLKRQATAATSTSKVETKTVEKFVLKDGQLARAEKLIADLDKLADRYSTFEEDLRVTAKEIRDAIASTWNALPPPPVRHAQPITAQGLSHRPAVSRPVAQAAGGNGNLGRAERAILTAAVQRLPRASSRAQLSVLSGYSIKSSSFANALGALRSSGYVVGSGDDNRATDAGVAALGAFDPLPTGAALVHHWMGQLGKAEASLLAVLVKHYPRDLDKDTLSAESGYSVSSSSFANALGKLRTLELVKGLRASEDLFD